MCSYVWKCCAWKQMKLHAVFHEVSFALACTTLVSTLGRKLEKLKLAIGCSITLKDHNLQLNWFSLFTLRCSFREHFQTIFLKLMSL